MLKRMILIVALMVCDAQASDGQQPIELAPDQAQVHGLYSFVDKDAELNRENVACALLICKITPYGKRIFDQCKDKPFKVGAKQDELLDPISDCEFIELSNADELTVDNGVTLKLSYETLEKIRSVAEDYHIYLQKKIQKSDAVLLWQAQGVVEKEVKEVKSSPSRRSDSVEEFKDMVSYLLHR